MLRELARSLLPPATYARLSAAKEQRQLDRVAKSVAQTTHLRQGLDAQALAGLLANPHLETQWSESARAIADLGITPLAGGVNPGDRRALYYLVRGLGCRRVLEVGTHIGASTVHLAAALRHNAGESGQPVALTTVDIEDCNHPEQGAWRRAGCPHSPRALMEHLRAGAWVNFETQPSLEFLAGCVDHYDLIFLDGDHTAATVYQELTAALPRLDPGGVVLLHDYFPKLQALWPDGTIKPGPWLAVERLRREGAALSVLPLGHLPWPTKMGTHITSLALVVGC